MVDEKLYELLAKMGDLFDSLSAEIHEYIGTQSKAVLQEYDVDKIVWTSKSGQKGPFELGDAKLNRGNADFEALRTDMKSHDGRMRIKGKFYWVFTDGDNIGRK